MVSGLYDGTPTAARCGDILLGHDCGWWWDGWGRRRGGQTGGQTGGRGRQERGGGAAAASLRGGVGRRVVRGDGWDVGDGWVELLAGRAKWSDAHDGDTMFQCFEQIQHCGSPRGGRRLVMCLVVATGRRRGWCRDRGGSPCRHVSAGAGCRHVAMSPCRHVAVSPCRHVAMSPATHAPLAA